MAHFPDSVRVPFTGAVQRDGPPLVPHSAAFPAAMMSLQVLMGISHDTHLIHAHNTQWRADHDYNRHYAVSGEGFMFLFDTAEYFRFQRPEGAQPLRECFALAGIPVEVYSNHPVREIDGGWASQEALTATVSANLANGLPVLVLGRTVSDRVLLATGYEKGGETLVAWTFSPGSDMSNKSFSPQDCQYITNWQQHTDAVALVQGLPQKPSEETARALILRSLARGEALLRAQRSSPHGVDVNYYDDWIASLQDEAKWASNFEGYPSVYPEIWDLAEGRSYMSGYLETAQQALGSDKLAPGIEAGYAIHGNMWRIHALAESQEGNTALKDSSTRSEIISIIKECRALDTQMADAMARCVAEQSQP